MIPSEVNFHNNKRTELYKIFITDKNFVYINGINECGYSYEFIKNSELKLYDNYSLQDIVTQKNDMGIKELYIEINEYGIKEFIKLEIEKKIKNEDELNITIFSKKIISKINEKETEVKIDELFEFLKVNNILQAFQIIQYIKLKKILNDFDVYKLYVLYSGFLKVSSPRFVEHNVFYLERLVLGLISLEKINLIL